MKKIADLKHKNENEVKKRQDEINAVKSSDLIDLKKKVNVSDKKSHESDKSKELKKTIKLPETMTGIVKNSPFQKFDKQANNLNKENKLSSEDADKTPKIKNFPNSNKNDIAKLHTQSDNTAKVKYFF